MLEVTLEARVLTLTLNRPETKNSLSPEIIQTLIEQLQRASEDPRVRVVVFTGTGSIFCSGMDTAVFADPDSDYSVEILNRMVPAMLSAFIDCRKPVVMAVNGPGIGFGGTVLGLADVVFMAESAWLKFPFTDLGGSPEACSTVTMPENMGRQQANWVLLASGRLKAERCVELGWALEVLPDDTFMDAVMDRVNVIADKPTAALVATKEGLMAPRREQLHRAAVDEMSVFIEMMQGPAFREAMQAMAEKRAPDFSTL